ncbi:unnamed protein product, partial [marine sediment metagenome]
DFIGAIEVFHPKAPDLYFALKNIAAGAEGGINPVTYSWTDSQGEHSIIVEVGDFKVPEVKDKTEHRGDWPTWLMRRDCLVLKHYTDEGNTWVKITRNDPANKEMGILARWNPTAEAADEFFSISRTSRVSYDVRYNRLKISGK